ncbi:MAG TPA: hypothetical protein VK157_07645 [Phycisphaerales bacterium]|nr:hypothetical protein [Phycisphaerales bacterium]
MVILTPKVTKKALPITIGACVVLALCVPARWQRDWVGPFGQLASMLVAPVSGPVKRLVQFVAPTPAPVSESIVAQLKQENDELRTQMLAERAEAARLRGLLEQMRVMISQTPDGVMHVPATVIMTGMDSGVLTVRAGQREGLDIGDVATVNAVQLLGKVTAVRTRDASVVPITAKNAGDIEGVVIVDGLTTTLKTRLKPAGNGTLEGDVEDKRSEDGKAIEPEVGQEVRLLDNAGWPQSAQMLVIGVIEDVRPSPRQPLRKQITVRPQVGDLTRVGEVIVRLPMTRDRVGGEQEKPR